MPIKKEFKNERDATELEIWSPPKFTKYPKEITQSGVNGGMECLNVNRMSTIIDTQCPS